MLALHVKPLDIAGIGTKYHYKPESWQCLPKTLQKKEVPKSPSLAFIKQYKKIHSSASK